jgi:signal transduction histidine kinase
MPIRQKLMRVIFLISGMVIFITCITFLTYQFFTSKKNVLEKTSAIGKIISANSTAALAFQSADDAKEILAALKAEPHIIAAALYDKSGNLFSYYPADADKSSFPVKPGAEGYRFTLSNLEGFQPVVEENRTLGSLYLKSDLKRLYNLLRLFVIVIIIVIIVSLLLSYFLSQILQKSISKPILALVETTKAISDKGDYSQRATKLGDDELGVLTDSFNHMLEQIQHRNLMLNEFNQNLEHKIAERTSELETVNKELESFSYSISHDLRAPLRSIIGFTSILEEDFADKLDGEAKRITSVIKSNTLKMGQLIDDLLSFSRMGRQEIKQSNFNTTEMVQQIIEELTANDKGIKWNISSLPDSNGDPNAIRQVWINLISNAIKYSRNNKEPNIEIGSFNDLSLPNQQIFFIKDNGVGFDEKYKNKLFKVFQRLHAADQFEGTGVGLAIVEKVISKHGGKVWTEAEVNKGACFYFSLPLKS